MKNSTIIVVYDYMCIVSYNINTNVRRLDQNEM